MALRHVIEDKNTGQLILSITLLNRHAFWLIALIALFFWAFSSLPASFLMIIIVLTVVAVCFSFANNTITLDRQSRTLTRAMGLTFYRLAPELLPFSQIEDIEVEHYQTNPYLLVTRWRVVAIDRTGNRVELNSGGGREEMLALARKIASMTGAPLIHKRGGCSFG